VDSAITRMTVPHPLFADWTIMKIRLRALVIAGALTLPALFAVPADAGYVYFIQVHGFGSTQYDAQQDADATVGADNCVQRGPDHFSTTSTGWEDTVTAECPTSG
jgi:hypothetical protein